MSATRATGNAQCQPADRNRSMARLGHYLTRPILRLGPIAFTAAVLAVLAIGWSNRDEGHLTPESGIGYWLGITGASMMLLLLFYPLRKRIRALRRLGDVPGWFRAHMVLGIVGPALILLHCNFKLGSLNSNVALVAMLTVVASGIVGRYLYAKVHKGLYGSKAQVSEIASDALTLRQALGDDLADADRILAPLRSFEAAALAPSNSVLSSIWSFLWSGIAVRRRRSRILRQARDAISAQAIKHRWARRERRRRMAIVKREVALYFAAVNKAARFAVYERLLALWHVLHLPLFLLLVLTATVHIIAVHLY